MASVRSVLPQNMAATEQLDFLHGSSGLPRVCTKNQVITCITSHGLALEVTKHHICHTPLAEVVTDHPDSRKGGGGVVYRSLPLDGKVSHCQRSGGIGDAAQPFLENALC